MARKSLEEIVVFLQSVRNQYKTLFGEELSNEKFLPYVDERLGALKKEYLRSQYDLWDIRDVVLLREMLGDSGTLVQQVTSVSSPASASKNISVAQSNPVKEAPIVKRGRPKKLLS